MFNNVLRRRRLLLLNVFNVRYSRETVSLDALAVPAARGAEPVRQPDRPPAGRGGGPVLDPRPAH